MQLQSKENIIKILKDNKTTFWTLYSKKNIYDNGVVISNFDPDSFGIDREKNIDQAINKSIEFLNTHLDLYKHIPGAIFSITMSVTKNSHGNNKIGPIDFTINGQPGQQEQPQQNNLSGYNSPQMMGYISPAEQERKASLLVQETVIGFERKRLEEDRTRFLDEVKEKQKEFDELEKKI